MSDKSRREVMGILAAGAATTALGLLSKGASAQTRAVTKSAASTKKVVSLTIASDDEKLLAQLEKAVGEVVVKTAGGKASPLEPGGPRGQWSQSGGWYQDLKDPWSQSGGWVLDLNGRISRLSEVEAGANPHLVRVQKIYAELQAQIAAAAVKR